MLTSKPRVWLLGLLALPLIASYVPSVANAQGPFFYHRASAVEGNGVKISAKEPEGIISSAGEQIFNFKLAGAEILITSPQAQFKGIIYNNALQGQAKILIAFSQLTVVKPSNCTARIGLNNTIKVYGHLAWTWDKSEGQLKEQPQKAQKPDWLFIGQELQQGAKELPSEVPIYTITLSGASCAIPATVAVTGSYAAEIKPPNVGEFSTTETQTFLESGALQHFWNGKENIGGETKLKVAGEPLKHIGEFKFKNTGRQGGAPQEVARFES